MLPAFVREGISEPAPISSMPGVVQHTRDTLRKAAAEAAELGLGGIMLFGVPARKDARGSGALDPDGILNVAIADVVAEVGDALPVMADLCLDEFTDHGHCGVLDDAGAVDNDATLAVYADMAIAQAAAGVDVVGPSGMMDGQVGAIRAALDSEGYTDVAILAYSAKYASAFYGPFREAVDSSLQGDRRTYQQDGGNVVEGVREALLDVDEGADMVMVKPALAYLDVVRAVREAVDVPGGGVQHLRRVLHGRGRRRARLDRPRGRDPRDADLDPARRCGHRAHLLGRRGRPRSAPDPARPAAATALTVQSAGRGVSKLPVHWAVPEVSGDEPLTSVGACGADAGRSVEQAAGQDAADEIVEQVGDRQAPPR